MKELFLKLKFIFTDPVLRKKTGFLFAMILVFRLFAAIPLPDVNHVVLADKIQNSFLAMINMFSGGGFQKVSIVMLGVMPYITASIIMQVLEMAFPKLKEMKKEGGEAGRMKIANISRIMSVFISAISAFGFIHLLQASNILPQQMTGFHMFINILVAVTGAVFLMWIGELISEFGIGNGLSLLIFAGIIASAPSTMNIAYNTVTENADKLPQVIGIFVFLLVLIYLIVFVSEAERPIPIHQTRSVRAGEKAQTIQTFLPIKLNQAGVIPIIFAISILMFPQMIYGFLTYSHLISPDSYFKVVIDFLNQTFVQATVYFVLVFFFTFFYTAVTFDPKEMAENLQKAGNFIPGIRPGEDTEDFLGKITTRVTFIGAVFLGFVAVIPVLIGSLTGMQSLSIGGTSLLIVVSVGIDLIRKINAQISVREYLTSLD